MYQRTIKDVYVVAFLMWLFFTILFVQDTYGKHYDDVRIPNNGIVSYYDFEDARSEDQVIRDKFGSNDMRIFGDIDIINGVQEGGWYSHLVQILGADGFSYLEMPFIPEYNSKSFSIGFYGGFGTVGLDVEREFGPWNLDKNYFWSWGNKIAVYITADMVEQEVAWFVEGDDEPETFTLEQYTTNLKFGDKTYVFYTHDAQFAYHQYVVVYDGANDTLMGYWDGQQHIRELNVSRPVVSGKPIRFATDHKLEHNFSGRFDEITFYNRPLTPLEVTRYYGGIGLEIKSQNSLVTTWGEMKKWK